MLPEARRGGEHLKKKQGNPADSLLGNRAAALRFHGRNNQGPLLHFYIDIHCNRVFWGFFALMIQVCSSSITGVYKKTSRAALFRQGFSIKHLVVLSITLVATKVCLVMHLIPCYRNFQNLPVKHK